MLPPLRFGEGGWGGGVALAPPLRFGEGGLGGEGLPCSPLSASGRGAGGRGCSAPPLRFGEGGWGRGSFSCLTASCRRAQHSIWKRDVAAQFRAGEALEDGSHVQAGRDLAQLIVHVPEQLRAGGVFHDHGRLAVDPARADDVVRIDPVAVADPAIDEVTVLAGHFAAPGHGRPPELDAGQELVAQVDQLPAGDPDEGMSEAGARVQVAELALGEVIEVLQTGRCPGTARIALAAERHAEQQPGCQKRRPPSFPAW